MSRRTKTPQKRTASPPTEREQVRAFLDGKVSEDVSKQYQSLLRNLTKNGHERTHRGFVDFAYAGPYKNLCPLSVDHMLTALNHEYVTDITAKVDSDMLAKAKAAVVSYGASYRKKFNKPYRTQGTIDVDKMRQLVQMMRRDNTPAETRLAIILQWGFSLRNNDMRKIRRASLERSKTRGGDVVWTVTVPKGKTTQKRALKGPKTETHELLHNNITEAAITEIFNIMNRNKQTSDAHVLFPKHTVQRTNPIIHKAAEEFGWNTDNVVYNGSHCLRRGGIVEGLLEIERQNNTGAGSRKDEAKNKKNIDETRRRFSGHAPGDGILPYLGDHKTRDTNQAVLNREVARPATPSRARRLETLSEIETRRKAVADAKTALRETRPALASTTNPNTKWNVEEFMRGVRQRVQQAVEAGTARRRSRSESSTAAPRTPASASKAAPTNQKKK